MHDLGVHTFADLRITLEEDPGMSLPESHRYRLLVHTSDITRGQLVHLPWDYDHYGLDRDAQDVGAVQGVGCDSILLRASSSSRLLPTQGDEAPAAAAVRSPPSTPAAR